MWSIVYGVVATITISGGAWLAYRALSRRTSKRSGKTIATAIVSSHTIHADLDRVPTQHIQRELRRALVLILSHHISTLHKLAPQHPYLSVLEHRAARLNKLPSSLVKRQRSSKAQRQDALRALDSLIGVIAQAKQQQWLTAKDADLGSAAARCAAQHLSVLAIRQAAVDAENTRDYDGALRQAFQAQTQAKRLPPLLAQALSQQITQDIERLQAALPKGLGAARLAS